MPPMETQHDPESPILRLRITHITSTMSTPLITLKPHYIPAHLATAVPPGLLPHQMPVLRIFGTTPSLQKICANIHLCYPYFYVPFPMDSTDPLRPERVIKLCQRFAVSLNHAICLAMRQNPTGGATTARTGGGADPKHMHVVSVLLVKGVPFYGYHIGYSYFLKVSLANPSRFYVAMEQLRKPVVLGREWQPHEAHMNHVLQFMADFDLYGCGWLDLGGGTFREPLPDGDPYAPLPKSERPPSLFDTLTVPENMLYPTALSPAKDTFAPLEIDVLPHHILNRRRLKPRELHRDFIELLHRPLDPDEKLVPAVAELWEDERRRRSVKGLSLSEKAMMPGSGGMGGRTKAELGYLEPGEQRKDQKGGDWKISEELWGMIEERMADERRKRGRLSFDRFSSDIRAGKDGEKLKYDKWILTAFDAVGAHWPRQPKPPRSTQKSKRSRRSVKTSPIPAVSSPPQIKGVSSQQDGSLPISSPIRPAGPAALVIDVKPNSVALNGSAKPPSSPVANRLPVLASADGLGSKIGAEVVKEEDEIIDDFSDFSDDEEEENPFELFASTQLPREAVRADINQHMISRSALEDVDEEDEEELAMQQHERDARQRAEDGRRYRATQASQRKQESDDEYGDEELDDLFRKTVMGGWSNQTTPRKDRGSMTPTTGSRSGMSSGGLESRRQRREARLIEQAGFGDLSVIMDRSSVSLSPSNPYDPVLRTPTKVKTPVSDKTTPTSLVRNMFARNRSGASPLSTPRRELDVTPNTLVLPPSRRSLGAYSPSPEEGDEREVTPTPSRPKRNGESYGTTADIKPKLEDLEVTPKAEVGAIEMPDPHQATLIKSHSTVSTASAPRLSGTKRSLPSPTLRNQSLTPGETSTSQKLTSQEDNGVPTTTEKRAKKRVRMASPESQLGPVPSRASQPVVSSAETLTSNQTASTDGTTSTLPPHFSRRSWQFRGQPPLSRDVVPTVEPEIVYTQPHYSNPVDVPPRAKMFAGRMFTLKGTGVVDLTDFQTTRQPVDKSWLKTLKVNTEQARFGWEWVMPSPRVGDVLAWCRKDDEAKRIEFERKLALTSQLNGPTQKNRYGFKFSQKRKTKESEREHQNMSVLAIEVFAKSRHQLLPDPEKDELTAIFFCYQNEDASLPDTTIHPNYHAGYIVIDSPQIRNGRLGLEGIPCHVVDSELDMINWIIDTVKLWDPDVLAGWELHNSSWGYLASRAQEAFNVDLMEQLSRVVSGHAGPKKDFYSATHSSTFKVSGRHILNIWRICRSEINLTQYTFENVVFHFLHQRIPHYSAAGLTALWKSKTPEHTSRVLKYFFQRVVIDMEVVDAAEIITKNAEFARVFGVDFASVMFRGSQYKVESFMFRIAKPESFILVSPSKHQVGLQNAPFAVPLIAEPESKYYTHPILVLDFQSLYPSVMIAYNICYSTCLGRVEKFKGTDKFGFTELKVADGLLELLKDYLTVTPNGMIFVKPAVRKSLLAKMLGEILDTRVMVKQAMKGARGNKSLLSLLNARQLGLKLMANVTYGYTSATYSGRMPCIEVADSIVQTGRETLEKAQELIHSRSEWGAQVVYGDTDSLFVALPGRSKDQAFRIGNEIADAVTAQNPKPVKLKFEKVYMGSVLMAKKRYVGFKYEHPDETEPAFDAKGIETIRRDGFPAQQKMEEVCLKMLFRTQDLSQIKEYCRQEWTKILQGRVSMQDFIVAKEVRLGSYSEKGVPPPGAAVAYRRILKDPRDEPQYAERVPYIISNADGRRLIDRARMPEEMLASRTLGIDAEYYIRNLLIPPISRIFNLVGADVEGWFDSMPRTKRAGKYETKLFGGADKGVNGGGGGARGAGGGRNVGKPGGMRIDAHFQSSHCIVCGNESADRICQDCTSDAATTTHALLSRQHIAQSKLVDTHKICASCSNTPLNEKIMCDSIDCPVLYARVAAERDVEDLGDLEGLIDHLGEGKLDW